MGARGALVLVVTLVAGSAGVALALRPAIDWNRLAPSQRRLVEPVVATSQVAREVAGIRYLTRREIWEYLLDHPDFASDAARIVREGRYRIRPAGDHYTADDGRGVRGTMWPVYAAAGRRIFYLEGTFDSRWLPPIAGRAVLVLDSRYLEAPGPSALATVDVAGYLRIDSSFIGTLLFLARNFTARTFDRRVRRFFGHVERLNRQALEDPHGLLQRLAAQPGIDQRRLAEFRQVLLGPAGRRT